jgi:ABC-type dipeptide/oligopeptide/nickel transport system ATPase component
MLPLHANAIEIEGRAVAFMGESGSGKSTLAAWFHDQGYKILADDVCVVGFDEAGIPHAHPGLPRLRLWDEALESLGRDASRYNRSYIGFDEQLEKFDVPIDHSAIASCATPLAAIYLLRRGDELSIAELRGVEAAEALFANTYRGSYLPMVKGQKEHWRSAVMLVRAAPVYRAVRQWDLTKLNEQCARLLAHARAAVATGRHEPS